MKNTRTQSAFWLQFGVFLAIWLVLIALNRLPFTIEWATIRLLPSVVGFYALIYVVFVTWAWRWRIFRRWLVVVPDLQGTWAGDLRSTWSGASNESEPDLIRVYLVIRQTLHKTHVRIFTAESRSSSESASLNVNEEQGETVLVYHFINLPVAQVRHRSEIHFGTARLYLGGAGEPSRSLEGEYWTDRKTTGHMSLHFAGRHLMERFPSGNDA